MKSEIKDTMDTCLKLGTIILLFGCVIANTIAIIEIKHRQNIQLTILQEQAELDSIILDKIDNN